MRGTGAEPRSRVEGPVMGLDRRGGVVQLCRVGNRYRESHVDKARPFCIAKREVWEAYKQVKANQGAAGVDEQSIAQFEENLSNNLYLIWSRMSSGSYIRRRFAGLNTKGRGCGDEAVRYTRQSRTGSPRRWSSGTWSRCWKQNSIRTPMATALAGRLMMPCRWREPGAGNTTGYWISTSNHSSIASTGI